MAHAQLIFSTPNAAQLLVFTKQTRLGLTADMFQETMMKPEGILAPELEYMAGTIPSSWEFVDLIFLMTDVSRAAAQQITRTRNASFAMQSLRVVDGSELPVYNPFCEVAEPELFAMFDRMQLQAGNNYSTLKGAGASSEQARGVLPLNVCCNLVAKYNLRAFVELCQKRSSLRVQGEYADLVYQMKKQALIEWPWAEPFFVPKHEAAIKMLEQVVFDMGMDVGHGVGWQIAKAIDLIRGE